jgi:hypothetical protein
MLQLAKKWITFAKYTFFKFIIFKAKNTFETNMFKYVLNWILSIPSVLIYFIIINVKILSNFEKEWCIVDKEKNTFDKKKTIVHSHFELAKMTFKTSCQFASNFEQWNFISNGT